MSEADDFTSDWTRRFVLKGAFAGGCALFGIAGLRLDALAATGAAQWPEEAFKKKNEADAVATLYGKSAEPSDKIKLDAPEIAENGAVVPLAASSTLPGVKSILLLVEKNPNALSAKFDVSDAVEANFATRVKMAQTSDVYAVAITADGKAHYAKKEVKVTLGGCGG